MSKSVRVLLADDHALFRAGISALMKTLEGIEIIAEASNGREAMDLCKTHRPDVVLMDIIMPQLNGLDATARLAVISPNTRTIILSMNGNEEYVLQALRSGAAGYLLKNISPRELEEAIRTVARGETYLSPAISKHVIAALPRARRRRDDQRVRAPDAAAARGVAIDRGGAYDQGDRPKTRPEIEDRGNASQPIDGCARYPRYCGPRTVRNPHGGDQSRPLAIIPQSAYLSP